MSTKAELQATLTAANVTFASKANKATLQAAVDALSQPARKQRVSTKQLIRDLFPNVGDNVTCEDVLAHVAAHTSVQAATIVTMIGDLKNSKYAAGPTINIVRSGDSYTRES